MRLLSLYSKVEPFIKRHPWLRATLRWIAVRLPFLLKLLQKSTAEQYAELVPQRETPLILIDITHRHQAAMLTGIQRVVDAVYQRLKVIVPNDVTVAPVVLSAKSGLWHFHYVDYETGQISDEIVVPRRGDIFLGIDLNALIINPAQSGLFNDWRRRGAQITFTVHDILPLTNPEWWPASVAHGHEQWLRAAIKSADLLLCVSQTTQDQVAQWATENKVQLGGAKLDWCHLGANFLPLATPTELSDADQGMLAALGERPSFLAVGTLEPRKGHRQCLDAFDRLWAQGHDVNLVFVGHEGWMVDDLRKRLENHERKGTNLFWLRGISDAYLAQIYGACDCLIMASEGEGFGLPLIEGAQYGLPIIARDIAVFRETAGENATYFSGIAAEDIANSVLAWLEDYKNGVHVTSDNIAWLTWHQSASGMYAKLTASTDQPKGET